jgi:LPS sulfotransferase NodH
MTKFILLGHRRSGSTLALCGLLDHGNVYVSGELFNEDEKEREKSFGLGLRHSKAARKQGITNARFYRDSEDAAEFIDKKVFFDHWWEPVAVGFKLFYHQARDTPGSRLAWEYLKSHPEVRIIHLIRRNFLESLLSLRIAIQTDEWARLANTTRPRSTVPPFYLNPQDCSDYFLEIEQQKKDARNSFHSHHFLEVEYERDLCGDFEQTIYRIQDFLNVPRLRARKLVERQAQRKPSQQISNYSELKEYFRPSPHSDLFE